LTPGEVPLKRKKDLNVSPTASVYKIYRARLLLKGGIISCFSKI
jgi:hypothetical protein